MPPHKLTITWGSVWGATRGRRGVALISVLWILALLALVASSVNKTTRTDVALVQNLSEQAKAKQLAEAGIHLGIYGLLEPVTRAGWRVDSTMYEWGLGDGYVRISIQDEAGKLDLNAAPVELIRRLISGLGLSDDESAALADAILDFRDPDDLHRLNGAEDREYSEAGLSYGPKNQPYASIEELRLVLGVTDVVYSALTDATTVYSGRRLPDWKVAAPVVARAFPAANVAQGPNKSSEEQRPPVGARIVELGSSSFRSDLLIYTVHSEGLSNEGGRYAIDAVVRVQPGLTAVEVLRWYQSRMRLFEERSGIFPEETLGKM